MIKINTYERMKLWRKKIEIKNFDKVDTLKKAKMWRHYEKEKKKKENYVVG